MASLRVGGLAASDPAPALHLRVGGLSASGSAASGDRVLRVGGIAATGPVPARTLRVGGIAASGAAPSTMPTSWVRPAGGTWQVGSVIPGRMWRRDPGGDWYEINTTGAANPNPNPDPGPNMRKIALIGDSTLNGIGETAMRNALVARGWQAANVWFYARSGKPIILNDDLGKNALVNMAEARAALGGDPDVWVFNLGSNGHRDSRNPEWIRSVLAAAGSAEVIWSGITQVNGYTDGNLSSEATRLAWNAVARPIIDAHTGGRFLDWHGYAKAYPGGDAGWWNADGVHHTTTGTARKLEFLVNAINTAPTPEPEPEPEPEPHPSSIIAGAAPLGTASYPIVGEARYVSTGGSDSAAGTSAAPWRSMQHAINNTPTGGTIVVRGGVHFTGSLSSPQGKTLRIINAPGETVWLDGTQEFTGWTNNGDGTWSTPYSITFQRVTPYAGTNPLRNHPDQVWLDATQLTQVADGTTPGAGQFSVNQTTDRLTIGSNPSGKIVRASVHNTLLVASGRVDLLGIGVRRYSPETMEFLNSMIYYGGTAHGSIIENCHFRESHMAALSATKNDMRISSNTFEDCGHAGVHTAGTVGLVFEKNLIRRVNRQGWQAEPTVAGIKVGRADQITIRHNVIYDVAGTYGIWLDVSVTRFNVYGNHVYAGSEAMKHGIEAELSDGGKYAGTQHRSYIVGNNVTGAKVGVLLFDTGYTTVANNDLRGNEIGFQVWQDSRYNDESTSNNRTFEECPWIARANESINNAYQTTGGYNIQLIAYDDGGRHNLLGLEMLTRIAGDWFNTAPPGAMVQLGRAGGARTSYNTPALLAAAGSDVGGPIGSKLGTVGQSSAYPTAAQMQSTAVPASAVLAGMLGVAVGTRLIGPNLANLPVPIAA